MSFAKTWLDLEGIVLREIRQMLLFILAKSCLTLCDPMDCSLPGFSIRGILQVRILEWVAISFSKESYWYY